MSIMMQEILSQKELLKVTYQSNVSLIKKLANVIKKSKIEHFEILARGSSRNAGELFKYLLETNSTYRVSFVYPSTITKYQGKLNDHTIYIAISQGGRGEDLRIVLKRAKHSIAITNEENSPLNKVSKHNLYLKVNKEKSMAATKTFTAETLLLAMLASELTNKNIKTYQSVNNLISLVKQTEINSLAKKLKSVKNLYIITRGKLLGVAKELACKLQETCFINANAYASSDFMHGPLALIDKSSHVLFLIPNDETKNDVINLMSLVKKEHAHVYTIGNYKTNKDVYPFVVTFAIQLLSATLSKELKLNPDKSRNINKYTKTI